MDLDTLFDSSQLAELYYLAFECPLKGGEATYRARGILSLLIDTLYINDVICGSDSTRMLWLPKKANPDDNQSISAKMFPNPAKDYVLLQLNKAIKTILQLRIIDQTGQMVNNSEIEFTAGEAVVNIASFNSGMYYVALYNSDGKFFNGKLAIFK